MALYLGKNKVKVNLGGVVYSMNIFTPTLILNGVMLLSSDDYILKDKYGVYLTVKESE